jgi:hypothetical protein
VDKAEQLARFGKVNAKTQRSDFKLRWKHFALLRKLVANPIVTPEWTKQAREDFQAQRERTLEQVDSGNVDIVLVQMI